jgi:hypothetical protein
MYPQIYPLRVGVRVVCGPNLLHIDKLIYQDVVLAPRCSPTVEDKVIHLRSVEGLGDLLLVRSSVVASAHSSLDFPAERRCGRVVKLQFKTLMPSLGIPLRQVADSYLRQLEDIAEGDLDVVPCRIVGRRHGSCSRSGRCDRDLINRLPGLQKFVEEHRVCLHAQQPTTAEGCMKLLLRSDEIIHWNPEAFELCASEAEVDLAAIVADASNLPHCRRAFGNDVCADVECGWRRGLRRLQMLRDSRRHPLQSPSGCLRTRLLSE